MLRPGLHSSRVLIVLITDVFQQVKARQQPCSEREGERTCIRTWIIDRDLILERSEIPPRESFDHVQPVGVRMRLIVEPGAIIEADRIDD